MPDREPLTFLSNGDGNPPPEPPHTNGAVTTSGITKTRKLRRRLLLGALVVFVGLWAFALTYSVTAGGRSPERLDNTNASAVENACRRRAAPARGHSSARRPPHVRAAGGAPLGRRHDLRADDRQDGAAATEPGDARDCAQGVAPRLAAHGHRAADTTRTICARKDEPQCSRSPASGSRRYPTR